MASKREVDSKTFKEKLEFFWKYNKIHVFIWAIGLIVLGIFLYQKITMPVLIFHGVFLNANDQSSEVVEELADDLLTTYNVDPTSGQVTLKNTFNYYPGNEEKAEENFDSSEYILVEKEKQSLDFIAGPLSSVQDIAYNGLFQDLRSFLTDEELDLCEPYFLYVDQAVITALSEAYEEDKDVSSIEIPVATDPDAMEDPIPIMIDISKSEKLSKLYAADKQDEPLVLAIMTDAPDTDLTLNFIQYLMK